MTSSQYQPLPAHHPIMTSSQLRKKWGRIVGLGCAAFAVLLWFVHMGRRADWAQDPSSRIGDLTRTPSGPQPLYLLKTNHIPNEGLASSINYMKDGLILGELLGRTPVMVRNRALFDYHPSTLVNGDLEEASLPGPFCDFHTFVATSRYDKVTELEGKLHSSENFTLKLIDEFCHNEFEHHREVQSFRHKTEQCRTLVYTTSQLHSIPGCWNRLNPLLTKRMGFDTTAPKTKISIHYRWGDQALKMGKKWVMDSNTLNKVVAKLLHIYGQDTPVELHMDNELADVGGLDAAKKRKELNFTYKLMNDVDVLRDLRAYAGTRVLIGSGGTYSSLISTLAQPELLLTNGHNQGNHRTTLIDGDVQKLLTFEEFLSSPPNQQQKQA